MTQKLYFKPADDRRPSHSDEFEGHITGVMIGGKVHPLNPPVYVNRGDELQIEGVAVDATPAEILVK